MVAALHRKFDPNVRPVNAGVIAGFAQRRAARTGDFGLAQLALLELLIVRALNRIARPGGNRLLDQTLRRIRKFAHRDTVALGRKARVFAGADVNIAKARTQMRLQERKRELGREPEIAGF